MSRHIITGSKILAADAMPGIIIMLAYFAGSHNLFPDKISPREFLTEEGMKEGALRTNFRLLSDLLGRMSKEIRKEMGQLQVGSLPIYLTALRGGFRANRNGRFPAVRVNYEVASGDLIIYPRSYSADCGSGVAELIPTWIKILERNNNPAE